MQSSKLTGLLLSVEILGDQSGTQNQHQQRNDESPLICGGSWALAGSTNRHKQRRRDQTDRSEKQQVSKFHNSSRTSHLYRRSSAFRGSSAVSHKSQRQSTTTAATIMTALVTKGTLAIR